MAALLATSIAAAGEPAEKPAAAPPIPFHSIEGASGVFITETAYFANMPEGDGWFGKPSMAVHTAKLGHKDMVATTITTNFFKRVEVGYSFMRVGLGDWPEDVRTMTTMHPQNHVKMHTFGARVLLINEGQWGCTWVPAVTAGVRYKHNDSIWNINRDLGGACETLVGVDDNDGIDVTLTASKMFVGILPRPFILSAGVRSTEAAQIGLLGFSGDRDIVFEGNAVFFLTDRLLLAGEFRQKPDDLGRVGSCMGAEHDWWTVCLGYIVTNQLTAAAGFGNFGNIANHEEDQVWAAQLKWEF
jgi:hypothetical protein